MGKICYVMGKSSSGKDTIFKELQKRMPELKTIILYTTRPIRAGEAEGVEYYFVNEEQLFALQEVGKIIELREYDTKHGKWKYFTADDGQIDLKKSDYFVIGTLESYHALCAYFGKEAILPVYVEVENGLRLSRALEREKQQTEPKYDEMCRRFLADALDFSEQQLEAAGIQIRFQNEDISRCLDEIVLYLTKNL